MSSAVELREIDSFKKLQIIVIYMGKLIIRSNPLTVPCRPGHPIQFSIYKRTLSFNSNHNVCSLFVIKISAISIYRCMLCRTKLKIIDKLKTIFVDKTFFGISHTNQRAISKIGKIEFLEQSERNQFLSNLLRSFSNEFSFCHAL